jgi:hypothetical protein
VGGASLAFDSPFPVKATFYPSLDDVTARPLVGNGTSDLIGEVSRSNDPPTITCPGT